jgi:hypothetical protein
VQTLDKFSGEHDSIGLVQQPWAKIVAVPTVLDERLKAVEVAVFED